MEYVFGVAVGVAIFFVARFKKPTTNDLSGLIAKNNKQKEAVKSRGKGLFS
jgi:hypothetical protein